MTPPTPSAETVVAALPARYNAADDLLSRGFGQRSHELPQGWDVLVGMIGMREVCCPEKLVRPDIFNHFLKCFLVWVSRDPALALEVGAGFLFELRRVCKRTIKNRIHTVEQVANPTRLGFEHNDFHLRKSLKHAVVEQ